MSENGMPRLPYDVGNAGDLLKHGVLAEFVRWRLKGNAQRNVRFLDLFGGLPESVNVRCEVIGRVGELRGTALGETQ